MLEREWEEIPVLITWKRYTSTRWARKLAWKQEVIISSMFGHFCSISLNSEKFSLFPCHLVPSKILKTSFSPQHFTFTKSKLFLLRKLAPPSRISWLHHLNLHCPPRGNRCLPRADSAGNLRSGMSTVGDPTNTLDICMCVCMCIHESIHLTSASNLTCLEKNNL